ncbi:hypothetical protein FHW36_110140 [Chitinophaga polysaccharea]|uniref:Uncharacterized protein n=1 Tax=Chitinophaga polysaccharea TaxID=1293035 RepID=A0A561PA31_9BACT|nr:hypothetical protein FHW36_110140 [Chitinophaga polysaccharea]
MKGIIKAYILKNMKFNRLKKISAGYRVNGYIAALFLFQTINL